MYDTIPFPWSLKQYLSKFKPPIIIFQTSVFCFINKHVKFKALTEALKAYLAMLTASDYTEPFSELNCSYNHTHHY